jgi:hypothetical protein
MVCPLELNKVAFQLRPLKAKLVPCIEGLMMKIFFGEDLQERKC